LIDIKNIKRAEDLINKRLTSSYRKIYLNNLDMNHGSPLEEKKVTSHFLKNHITLRSHFKRCVLNAPQIG